MTEEEARKKWCPASRIACSAAGDVYVNIPGGRNETFCIASECMAWRGDTEIEHKPGERLGLGCVEKPAGFIDYDTPDSDGWLWGSSSNALRSEWWQYRPIKTGHCGLAGAP